MFKSLIRYLFFLIIAIGIFSCSRPPQELKTAEGLIEAAPDSAFHILRNISPNRYKSSANRALYGLLMTEVLGKKKIPIRSDSLLDYSIDYYSTHSEGNLLASCYLYKGRAFKYKALYEKAMQYYLKAFDEIKDFEDYILIGRINYDLGDIYNSQGDQNYSRQKYTIAYNNFSKAKLQLLAFYSLVNIGRTYHDAKQYGIAEKYFKKIFPQALDSLQQGALYQEIGLNYYDSNKLDSAFLYFRKVLKYPYISNNKAIRYFRISHLFFQLNRYDSAFLYAYKSIHFEPDIRTERECYRILSNSEFRRGNMQAMSIYMNKYVILSDSIRKIDAQIKGSYMETIHIAKKEAALNKNIAWYLAGLIILLIIAGYFLFKLFTRNTRKEKNQIIETHHEEKRDIHKKVIEDKWTILQKQIEDHKKILAKEYKNAGSHERENQLRKTYIKLLHFDKPDLFFKEMDKSLNKLITKLKSRHTTLTDKELMLCCYLLLHIPTYDMLIIFDYKSDDSLKSLKRRLTKKLELDNATLLEDFLLNILSEN